MAAAGTTSLEF
jgi:hypothetical protein